MTLVLASASPRRQELLSSAGIEFVAVPANIPEVRHPPESPTEFAERMAREKARAVWSGLEHPYSAEIEKGSTPRKPEMVGYPSEVLVLGADTVVVVDDVVLGKPSDENDAARMLRLLAGRKHLVVTGVCLRGNDFEDVRSEATAVYFSTFNDRAISSYIGSGEPLDKAGAYAIQGGASKWVSKIEGDYNNVVGLPVDLVLRMLRDHGIS